MKRFINAVLKFLALICAGLLVVVLPLALTLYNGGEVMFSRQVLENITTTVMVDSEFTPGALEFITNQRAEEISRGMEEEQKGEDLNLFFLIEGMDIEDWRNIHQELLTDEILGGWIRTTYAGLFDWLDTEEQLPEIQWDMQPLIERMQGPAGERVVNTFYNSLPDCTDLEMEEMQTGEGDPLPKAQMVQYLCKLSTFPHQEQITVYREVFQLAIERVPPAYDFTQGVIIGQSGGLKPLAAKRQLRAYRRNTDLALLLPLGLLFSILVLGVRSLTGLGQWWGIPLTGGCLIAFLTSLLFRPLWTGLLSENMPEVVPATSVLYHELISGSALLVSRVFSPLRWQSFLLLLVGLGLVAMGFLVQLGGEKEEEAPPEQ